mgnify:FL=1
MIRKKMDELTPKEIVSELDKFIISQNKAKKIVAMALRNRVRRQRLPDELRDEIAPKNIIMIGPTGVGKTEIARRLSRLCGAPFIKVEATKYTEVGYVGRDVESMVRDLLSVAISLVKEEMREEVEDEAQRRTEEALLDLLLPGGRKEQESGKGEKDVTVQPLSKQEDTRDKFRKMLKEGKLEDKKVEISVSPNVMPSIEIFSGQSFEEMGINFGNISDIFGGNKKKKKVVKM